MAYMVCFFRCPAAAEWEGGEGMCLTCNCAELPWQALLQGYRLIKQKYQAAEPGNM